MRLFEGKESLMVFDFVDNASQYNMPQSLHRLFKLKDYQPGRLAVAPGAQKAAEADLYARGEKPEALIDWPVDATDYELVDIFNWQEEADGMISQMEFVRRVDVETETIERYVRGGKLVPDLVVPMSEHRAFKYFKEESLQKYVDQYDWTIIDDSNRKDIFMRWGSTLRWTQGADPSSCPMRLWRILTWRSRWMPIICWTSCLAAPGRRRSTIRTRFWCSDIRQPDCCVGWIRFSAREP